MSFNLQVQGRKPLDRVEVLARHLLISVDVRLPGGKVRIAGKRIQEQNEAVQRANPGIPSPLADLAEYLGLSEREAARKAVTGPRLVAAEWAEAMPVADQEVLGFYEQCNGYLFDLTAWNVGGTYRKLLDSLAGEADGICLCFGGGLGTEALALARQNRRVFYCDVPGSPVWKFAQWRARKADAAITFVAELPEGVQFDCIVAFDVFEHLTEAQLRATFPQLVRSLKTGGRLHCENGFTVLEDGYPMHFDHRRLWDSLLEALPLEKKNERLYVKSPSSSPGHGR